MNNKVFVSKVTIKNAYGISDAVLEPGAVTVIKGKNKRGKTSLINAIQAAFRGGNDPALLKNDGKSGEVVVSLTDNVVVTRKFTNKTNRLEVTKNGEPVPEPQSFLNTEYLSSIGSNPLKLLTATKSQRTKLFLDTVPLDIDIDAVENITGTKIDVVEGEHGMVTLDRVRKSIYDERTYSNRLLSEKEKMIKGMKKCSVADANEQASVIQLDLDELNRRRDNILGSESEALTKAEGELNQSVASIQENEKTLREQLNAEAQNLSEKIKAVNDQLEVEIKRLEAAAKEQIDELKLQSNTKTEDVRNKLSRIPDLLKCASLEGNQVLSNIKSSFESSKNELSNEIRRKSEALDSIKLEINRNKEIKRFETELEHNKKVSDNLTKALESLDEYKLGLLKEIKLPGFDYKEGKIFIDGVPFEAVNTARLMDVAVDLARLQSPKLGLMCIDGAEALDEDSFALFIKKAKESNMHLIVTQVTNDEEIKITEAA